MRGLLALPPAPIAISWRVTRGRPSLAPAAATAAFALPVRVLRRRVEWVGCSSWVTGFCVGWVGGWVFSWRCGFPQQRPAKGAGLQLDPRVTLCLQTYVYMSSAHCVRARPTNLGRFGAPYKKQPRVPASLGAHQVWEVRVE